ncbi:MULTISPECIES: PRTRC system ParB family protein [Massilia]|jgi:PRTRC genetic system ParB family protein|uniref:PRTRC system ParB family protein n=1 Tax=Massilia TaxID=149698 RepID=UPI0004E31D63|nr:MULTISPECIES: PRTRC system ParB family protein [Massilia]KFC72619.1 ParB-like partition protein [Massilia sp. LC238]
MQLSGHIQPLGGAVSPAVVNEAITNLETVAAPGASVAPAPAAKRVAPEAAKPAAEAPRFIKLKHIREGNNPRTYFDPTEMAELVASVSEHGVAQAILVRPKDGGYEIIAGHRRYRAALEAHGEEYDMPVVVRECSDAEAEVLANVENTVRADMSPIEEAVSAASVVGRVKGDREEAARLLSWSRGKLDSRLALMNCADVVRTALNERKILLGHAELFASLAKDRQEKLLPAILEKKTSVAELKAVIEQASSKLESAIFDKSDCNGCAHNSTVQASMFEQSITDGSCTNSACYKQKTEDQLQSIAVSLKDEYPVIRIVRVGDNSTLVKLSADGKAGVGTEQAEACRSCANFGAAVSGLPQGMGKVFKDQCFDTVCNSQKVAARIQSEQQAAADAAAEAAAQAAAAAKGAPADGTAKAAPKAGAAPKAAPVVVTVNEGDRVKAYREKVWRAAMQKEIAASPDLSARYLLALCLNESARHISGSKLSNAMSKLTDQTKATDLGGIAAQVCAFDDSVADRLTALIAVSAIDNLEVSHLQRLAKYHKLDLTKHWKLDKEFLELLTKSEIGVIAKSVGLDKAIGDGFAKLANEKKDDLIKKLLGVKDFDYSATIPPVLMY